MRADPRSRRSLYAQLEALPEGLTSEIRDGQLYAHPHPSSPHGLAANALAGVLVGPIQKGGNGRGGWWLNAQPELHFRRDTEIAVPDLPGWRRERLPEDHRRTVVPDRVCDILSKSTASIHREVEMPSYARFGVAHAWLVEPTAQTLEACALPAGEWVEIGRFGGKERVSVTPFAAVKVSPGDLWAPTV